MKKIYLLILTLCIAYSMHAQDWVKDQSNLYYLSTNGKVFIQPDYSAMAVYFKGKPNETVISNFQSKISQSSQRSASTIDNGVEMMSLKGMMRIKSTKGLNSIESRADRSKFLDDYELTAQGAYEVLPAFQVDGIQAWLTKRIVIKLKPGIDQTQIHSLLQQYGGQFLRTMTNAQTLLLSVDQLENQLPLIHALNQRGLLEWGEPDFKMEIVRRMDPLYPDQWHLNNTGGTDLGGKALLNDADIDAPEAWAIALGNNVTVAVIDDGLENHEDLATLLAGFTPANSGNGSPSVAGDGHGQQCGGLIGALHNNIGVRGVSPGVDMFSVNIFAPNTTNADVATGIDWAVNNGADVLSNSWGFTSCTANIAAITSAFNNAATNGRGGLGCIILVASGNDFGTCVSYPANLSSVTAVGGVSGDGARSNFSNYGPTLDIVAPSNDDWQFDGLGRLISTEHDLVTIDREGSAGWFSGNYSTGFGGTSGATPIAAGVAALVLSVDPSLTKAQVENILYTTADDIGPTGFDNEYGNGRVNAYQAVLAAGGGSNDTTAPTVPNGLSSSNITATAFDISWNASTDDTAVTGYNVYVNGSSIGSVAGTSSSVTSLAPSTTYSVSVSAFDAAGNESGQSSSISVTTGAASLNCSSTVSSFPYGESFEANDGWTQIGGDDGDWVRDSGGTPSSNTGPSSGADGSFYLFLEASTNSSPGQIGNNATAILESPCFDLSGESTAGFSFQNHMFGSNVGSLTLQTSVDDLNWTNVWSLSGNQGNQWNTVNVNLDTYTGGTVKLRIVGTTGNGWSSDIAIDALAMTTGGGGGGGCSNVTVDSNDFESGWGIWNDGGSDARRSSSDAAYSNGTYSIRLRDNTSTSTMTTDNLDLSSFEDINVAFSYLARSMDNSNEDFWLQISTNGGSSYTTVEEWNQGDEFVNDVRENDAVTVNGPFTATTRLRFRCDASGNSDWVYIDDVVITGCTTSPSSSSTQIVTNSTVKEDLEEEIDDEVRIYPNPVRDILRISNLPSDAFVQLVTLTGRVISQNTGVSELEVSSLKPGLYLLQVTIEGDTEVYKVKKQ